MRGILLLAVLLAGCARAAAPSADAAQRPFPDMAGRVVFVLPVQPAVPPVAVPPGGSAAGLAPAARAALQSELAYWLGEGAPRVRWIHADAVERAVERAPSLQVNARDLPVHDFLRARLEAIGDPLYTELRKVGALLDTRPALLPVGAVWVADGAGTGRVHVALALIDTTGGAVHWQGIVAGAPAPSPDGPAFASAARAVARMVAGS